MNGEKRYDAVVIGAGPAGSTAALRVAEAGLGVLLVEKRERVGSPVRCAEATGHRGELERFFPVREEWITGPIDGGRFISPGGTAIEKRAPGIGVMLDRERFDAGAACAAAEAGAQLRTGCAATGLLRGSGGAVEGVRLREEGREWTARCRVVVAADGIEALAGRWAGLAPRWTAAELFSCAEARIRTARRRPDGMLEFRFGNEIAPGGYAWAFPRADGIWNVGLGVETARAGGIHASAWLERYLERFEPGAEIVGRVAGAACRARSLRRISGNGTLLAGDAARQGNPLTGGGIMNALEAGDLAGRTAARALEGKDGDPEAVLAEYDRAWARTAGRLNDRYLRLADVFYRYDDAMLEKVWMGMARIFRDRERGTGRLRLAADLLRLPGSFLSACLPILRVSRNMRRLF
ncbi:MAG: NAD(P)/FAD-dependent oxidoreductase [Candidatus Eisenbacteria bacterium]|nr:NAD(P)/FAD-dependent oxidoreductase [Candidatus Eisenbacteria bacterium]